MGKKKIIKAIEEYSESTKHGTVSGRNKVHSRCKRKLKEAEAGTQFLLLLRSTDIEIFDVFRSANDKAHAVYWYVKFRPDVCLITITEQEYGIIEPLTEEQVFQFLDLNPNQLPDID